MIRFAIFCWLAIWSASVAAEAVNDVRSPAFRQETAGWGEEAGAFGNRKNDWASIGWYSYLSPRDYGDARYHTDSQVFDRIPTPGLSLNWSGSSVALFRNGLRYEAQNSPWFLNVNYRNVNRGSKLSVRSDPEGTKVKALILEIGVAF